MGWLCGFSHWYLLACNEQRPRHLRAPGQREERAPGPLPPPFSALADVDAASHNGRNWSQGSCSCKVAPAEGPKRGECKGSGAKTSDDGQQESDVETEPQRGQ